MHGNMEEEEAKEVAVSLQKVRCLGCGCS